MSKVSVVSFRAIIPALTIAGAPVVVKLSPICPALVELQMWATSIPVLASSGFRIFSRDGQIIPDNGSNEIGITYLENEADWAPLPNTRFRIGLYDKLLSGPPYDLELQFYSAAAIEVGGLIVARDPQHGINDLVLHLSSWMAKVEKRD